MCGARRRRARPAPPRGSVARGARTEPGFDRRAGPFAIGEGRGLASRSARRPCADGATLECAAGFLFHTGNVPDFANDPARRQARRPDRRGARVSDARRGRARVAAPRDRDAGRRCLLRAVPRRADAGGGRRPRDGAQGPPALDRSAGLERQGGAARSAPRASVARPAPLPSRDGDGPSQLRLGAARVAPRSQPSRTSGGHDGAERPWNSPGRRHAAKARVERSGPSSPPRAR